MDIEQIWPPYQVSISSGDLALRLVRDEDLAELVDLVLDGIHDPELMPFAFAWTDADPADLPANYARHHWKCRSEFSPERFDLEFAVRRNGEMVGIQGFSAQNFAITRTGETGSWLAQRYHGQGIGTRMRRAVCTFVFEALGATRITSGAFVDNPASMAVSRKVGYQPNGIEWIARRGQVAVNQRLVLSPDDLVLDDQPITICGAAALRRFLGLEDV